MVVEAELVDAVEASLAELVELELTVEALELAAELLSEAALVVELEVATELELVAALEAELAELVACELELAALDEL